MRKRVLRADTLLGVERLKQVTLKPKTSPGETPGKLQKSYKLSSCYGPKSVKRLTRSIMVITSKHMLQLIVGHKTKQNA